MSRSFAFLVAFLSLSTSRQDFFVSGFLVASGVKASAPTGSSKPCNNAFEMPRTESIICRRRRTHSNTMERTRRTHLFSETTKIPWFCDEVSTAPATPTSKETERSSRSKPTTSTPKSQTPKKLNAARFAVTQGPDPATKPEYENIHGPLGKTVDNVFLYVFRTRLAEHVGIDSKLPKTDFAGLMELTAAMNARYSDRKEIQKIAQRTLRSLFPSWLPGQFAILFSKPFPEFSSRMNAWATYMAGQWLMGECEINDIEIDGKVMKDQGLLVKRCRFLEESGCASVCVNSCKIPTQRFFIEDMGLPLTMTPDYDTHECQFSFGRMPTEQDDLDAMGTPCLSRCPTAGSMRQWHNGNGGSVTAIVAATGGSSTLDVETEISSQCAFMENPSEENETQVL